MVITVTRYSRLYEDRGPVLEDFVKEVYKDLHARGYSFEVAEAGVLIYEDSWNRARIRITQEDNNLRYLYTIRMSSLALIGIIIGILLILIVGIVIAILWYIKYSSLKKAMTAAGETAATRVPPLPPPPPPT